MDLQVGITGAGNIATRHLANLAFLGGNRVVGICDLDLDRAGELADQYGATPYGNFEAMFMRESLDAVVICTPPMVRVPCVLHWPKGLGTGGRKVDGLVEKLDMLPTLLGLCGGHVPEVMPGRCYATDLLSGKAFETREDVIAFSHPNSAMLCTENYKYCRFPASDEEILFDIKADPQERHDVAGEKPDVIQALRGRMLDRFLDACRSPREHVYLF